MASRFMMCLVGRCYYRLSEAGRQGIELDLKLILEYQASQLAIITICILLSSYVNSVFWGKSQNNLIPMLVDQTWTTLLPKKGKKSWSKITSNGLKWILKACFFLFFLWILSTSWNHLPTQMWINPHFFVFLTLP